MSWLSFIELEQAVVHVIRLASCLWLCFHSVCPLMPSLSIYCLTGISLTLDIGCLLTAACPDLGRGVSPLGLSAPTPCSHIVHAKCIPAATAKLLQSCPTLCSPIDGSPPGSAVPGILQARTLAWVAISFSSAWKWKVKVKSLSCVRLFGTLWTAAYQAPLSLRFSRQEWLGQIKYKTLLYPCYKRLTSVLRKQTFSE